LILGCPETTEKECLASAHKLIENMFNVDCSSILDRIVSKILDHVECSIEVAFEKGFTQFFHEILELKPSNCSIFSLFGSFSPLSPDNCLHSSFVGLIDNSSCCLLFN
jgi:hypothetical protein